MNNRVLIAAIAGGIVSYLLGWLFFGVLLKDMTSMYGSATGVAKTDMGDMWALALGNIGLALFLALIFSRWAGINTLKGGAMAGAWIGFLVWLSVDLIFLGTTNVYSLTGVIIDSLVSAVMGLATGGVVGWVLGYGQRS